MVTLSDIKKVNPETMCAHFNLWLFCECPPSAFRDGVTLLFPKLADSRAPSKFRPITIGTLIARVFHRLLAIRLDNCLPLSGRQKGFRKGDGLADNGWILRSIIKDQMKNTKPLCVTFVDVAKDFDSVSHDTICLAAMRFGVPRSLTSYIDCLYTGRTTQLRLSKGLSRPITVRRGVRQSDPLSSILFNAVMDWIISGLSPGIGVEVKLGVRLNHLVFGDVTAQCATSVMAMNLLLREFEKGLQLAGLRANPAKSASLRIEIGRAHV